MSDLLAIEAEGVTTGLTGVAALASRAGGVGTGLIGASGKGAAAATAGGGVTMGGAAGVTGRRVIRLLSTFCRASKFSTNISIDGISLSSVESSAMAALICMNVPAMITVRQLSNKLYCLIFIFCLLCSDRFLFKVLL